MFGIYFLSSLKMKRLLESYSESVWCYLSRTQTWIILMNVENESAWLSHGKSTNIGCIELEGNEMKYWNVVNIFRKIRLYKGIQRLHNIGAYIRWIIFTLHATVIEQNFFKILVFIREARCGRCLLKNCSFFINISRTVDVLSFIDTRPNLSCLLISSNLSS